MGKPHKHAELIKAWADGAEIEACHNFCWLPATQPGWSVDTEYRIKPTVFHVPEEVMEVLIEAKGCAAYMASGMTHSASKTMSAQYTYDRIDKVIAQCVVEKSC